MLEKNIMLVDEMLPKFCNGFFIKRFTLSLYPILIVLLTLTNI